VASGLSVLATALFFLSAQSASAQGVRNLEGRVTDAQSGAPIDGVDVRVERMDIQAVTDADGHFVLRGVPGIEVQLRFGHIAYGVLRETVGAGADDTFLRVRLTPGVIELEPVGVSVVSAADRARRGRGTRRNIVTRQQIEQSLGTSATLATALERFVTGVRIKSQQVQPGDPVCVEFRSIRSLDNPNACRPPVVIMDGVRISNPMQFFSAMPLEDVETLEVLPPGEAGVRYGADSNRGVLLIQTRSGASTRPDAIRTPVVRYDFAVEGVPYNWKRTFAAAFAANALGVVVGVATARSCLTFNNLSDHLLRSDCGKLATVGVRLALVTLPLGSVAYTSRRVGRTEGSTGQFWPTLVGAALIGVPGYFLSATGPDDAWAGAGTLGQVLVLVGMPAVATLTDRLFRSAN